MRGGFQLPLILRKGDIVDFTDKERTVIFKGLMKHKNKLKDIIEGLEQTSDKNLKECLEPTKEELNITEDLLNKI